MKAFLLKLFIKLSAKLPLRTHHKIGRFIGYRLAKGNSELKRATEINIRLCFPKLPADAQQQLITQSLIETGKTFTESSLVWECSQQRFIELIKEVHGEEHIKTALDNGKGLILAMPHLGNWEALALYCSLHYPMTTLYRPPKLNVMDKIVRQARERFGATLVPTNSQGIKALYSALKKGEIVAILPDQDPLKKGGCFAPFFGVPANTMTLLSRLIHKSDAVVVCGYAKRLPDDSGFAIHFFPAEGGIYNKDMRESVNALNQSVEAIIKHSPEQYLWSYKRFKQRPHSEINPYDEHLHKKS